MNNWKKQLARVLCMVFLLSALAACGQPAAPSPDLAAEAPAGGSQAEAPAGDSQTEAPADDGGAGLSGTITVNSMAQTGEEAGWKAVAKAYMAINPGVDVVVDLKPEEGYPEWVQNIFTTASPTADIVNINNAGSVAVGKSINYLEYADMDSPYSGGPWTDQFNYSMQVRDLARGEWTALSLNSVQVIWLYNKDIFEEVGVEAPATWSEFVAVCEKISEAGYQPISIAGDFDSFWAGAMGWLAQIYADQTTRSMINVYRAQEGDYNYDPDIDGVWAYDPADPYNDDTWLVNTNEVRGYKAIADGEFAPDSVGMRTVWESFAQIFPQYAGGDAFFGTKQARPLFYQGKAAIMVDGAWALMQYENDMAKVAGGEEVLMGDEAVEGITRFELGTFNMPSMEGAGIEAKARTIEVANGFLGCIAKDKAHDDLVVDFLMYFSSKEGQSEFMNAAIADEYNVSGPSLVYGVELPSDIKALFADLEFIGNGQKGFGNKLARGMAGSAGDIQESYRLFYDYSFNFLSGNITVDDWLARHKANVSQYLGEAMELSGVSRTDLENPQNAPSGQ
jgi:ABC-type glycerol-3-phosphate transport system substrate-binding protein